MDFNAFWDVKLISLKLLDWEARLSFIQNEEILTNSDELDELDRITHAWKAFNYSLTQEQKTF